NSQNAEINSENSVVLDLCATTNSQQSSSKQANNIETRVDESFGSKSHQSQFVEEEDEHSYRSEQPNPYSDSIDAQMEVNLNEEDIFFYCSFPNCSFKSKSWTQVQAHEFRRHK